MRSALSLLWGCVLWALISLACPTKNYGLDVSYPIHYPIKSSDHPIAALNYVAMMEGCFNHSSYIECLEAEQHRLLVNRVQPSMQHNYTATGFKKLKLPQEAWDQLFSFYNAHRDEEVMEPWRRTSTFSNHWASPSSMVNYYNIDSGKDVAATLGSAIKPIVEEWINMEVELTSLYGIRVYKRGSILATRKCGDQVFITNK
ncbi:hypothetical protein EON65_21915 [archaeon]|nr:MAG: hypothetical protein EON65_21915 [archaeon]